MKMIEIGYIDYAHPTSPEVGDSGGFDDEPRTVKVYRVDPGPDPHDHCPMARIFVSCGDVALTMPPDAARDLAGLLIKAAQAVEKARAEQRIATPSTGCAVCDRGPTEMQAGQHVFRARGGAVTGSRPCTAK